MNKNRKEDLILIESFLSLLNEREQEHCYLFDKRVDLTREQNDLLHELENNPETDIDVTDELYQVRKEYRQTKNDMEFYFPIKNFSKKYKAELENAIKEMKQVDDFQQKRKMTPRVRTDLSIETTGGRKPRFIRKFKE